MSRCGYYMNAGFPSPMYCNLEAGHEGQHMLISQILVPTTIAEPMIAQSQVEAIIESRVSERTQRLREALERVDVLLNQDHDHPPLNPGQCDICAALDVIGKARALESE